MPGRFFLNKYQILPLYWIFVFINAVKIYINYYYPNWVKFNCRYGANY